MIRAVLDANVVVSGILSQKGIPGTILRAWREERFELVTTEAILEEITRVLRYPKIAKRHEWSEKHIAAFVEDLRHLAILTPGELRLAVVREDPSDDRYLECALEGEAEYIVTGDRHLLELGQLRGTEIVKPAAFLQLIH
jgi:hypothetical protein